ncbi:MAG: cytochrome c3 family protein [bacterium]|nr:cytochrome c3 family protein [bacterium]
MKRLIFAIALLAGLVYFGYAAVEPSKVLDPEDRRLRKAPESKTYFTDYNNGTIVVFNHKEHAQGYGLECIYCHHVEACSDCHRKEVKDVQVEESKVAFHETCLGCHREVELGPRECDGCHHK